MRIYPAIDIKDGKCVRLVQGKFDKETIFNEKPADVAADWEEQGASFIHVVDLDGARQGTAYNDNAIKEILKRVKVPIQLGGGIRTMEDIESKLKMGVSRVILGTAAIENDSLVKEAVKKYGDKIAVGVDASKGMAAGHAWEKVSGISAEDLCMKMVGYGVKTIIYTDISKDGMMTGPNVEKTKEIILLTKINIIASGGVSSMADLEKLKDIEPEGAIIGKALYEKAIDLKEAINKFEII